MIQGFYIFRIEHFRLEIVKFYQFFRVVLLQIRSGSGASRIRTDFFLIRILLTSFGSDRVPAYLFSDFMKDNTTGYLEQVPYRCQEFIFLRATKLCWIFSSLPVVLTLIHIFISLFERVWGTLKIPPVCRDRRGGVYYETAWQTALSAPAQIGEGREKLVDYSLYRLPGFPVSLLPFFLSLTVFRWLSLLTGEGVGKNQIIRRRESLVLYNIFVRAERHSDF